MAKLTTIGAGGNPRGKTYQMTIKQVILILATLVTFAFPTTAAAQQHGKASYYSNRLHGRRTSDGSRYHKDSLTCAHRTLPFGTLLKVTNKNNGKEVVVKVTDRGPFGNGRVVDLSMAAARELGMVGHGVASVKVERIGTEGQAADDRPAGLPEMKYLDPATGRYYSMKEWKARGEERRQQQAHYRVLNTKLTAKNATRTSTHKRNK